MSIIGVQWMCHVCTWSGAIWVCFNGAGCVVVWGVGVGREKPRFCGEAVLISLWHRGLGDRSLGNKFMCEKGKNKCL